MSQYFCAGRTMRRICKQEFINSTASLDPGIKLSSVTSNSDSFFAKSSAHLRILSHRLPLAGITRSRSFAIKSNKLSLEMPAARCVSFVSFSSPCSFGRKDETASVTMWFPRPAFCRLSARSGTGEVCRVRVMESVAPLRLLRSSSTLMVESEPAETLRSAGMAWGLERLLEMLEGVSVVLMMRGMAIDGSTEVEREELPDLSCLLRLKWLKRDMSRGLNESRDARWWSVGCGGGL